MEISADEKTLASARTTTYADAAVNFIRAATFQVTDDDLRPALGLVKSEYPSTRLSGAIAAGRLVKQGKFWALGPKELPPECEKPGPVTGLTTMQEMMDTEKLPQAVAAEAPVERATVLDEPFTANLPPLRVMPKVELPAPPAMDPLPQFLARETALKDALMVRSGVGESNFALWSDGRLQIARGGQITETLTRAEVVALRKYLFNTSTVA